jgi:hypothetical protein
MGIQIEIPVSTIADLRTVDLRVRALCNTTEGAQCQSLLTMEYQSCRHRVAQFLLKKCLHSHASDSREIHTMDTFMPKQPRMVGTFLKVHTQPRLVYALWCRGY